MKIKTMHATRLNSIEKIQKVIEELDSKRWLCRGQSRNFGTLIPSICRGRGDFNRLQMLDLERRSIDTFREYVKCFSGEGEMASRDDDIIALMVLQHYGVPTRLLDWSLNPRKAIHFAIHENPSFDGELWAFDQFAYAEKGKEQWLKWPETTTDGSGTDELFDAKLTAFLPNTPIDWFICPFYYSFGKTFPRQEAQEAAFSMTLQFGKDHVDAIRNLLKDPKLFVRYTIPSHLKPSIIKMLKDEYNICRGSLFPDSAGTAETVKLRVFPDK